VGARYASGANQDVADVVAVDEGDGSGALAPRFRVASRGDPCSSELEEAGRLLGTGDGAGWMFPPARSSPSSLSAPALNPRPRRRRCSCETKKSGVG
jgi:hypothetical protein